MYDSWKYYEPSSGDQPEFFEEVFSKMTSFDNELIVGISRWRIVSRSCDSARGVVVLMWA